MAKPISEYGLAPLRPITKEKLTIFKEVAGLTYDEAVYLLLMSFLRPEDEGSVARAGLRVRESREKEDQQGNQEGLPVFEGSPCH